MPKHNNASISDWLNRIFRFKAGDTLSNEIHPQIVPVISLKPTINFLRANTTSNSTSSTMLTTPTDKDLYITNASLSVIKDVTATSTASAINITLNGVSNPIIMITGFTLTVQDQVLTISFPIPIKPDRGTNITLTNTTNVGNVKCVGIIQGYYSETLVSNI